ncbi:DUF6541 family protein [Agromyces sp. Leaf222]|uniref:DUF6541 family protein n=1 Tax=Agromyces sp. Leaf222 TaxID=1735688 RepID=UPI0006F77F84|nr:DUF6541 family protein [Agromyces sp. Leaf222]KQM84149.1 hypothetical protein ASE68_13840 [Agromyces sp. Leaf222]
MTWFDLAWASTVATAIMVLPGLLLARVVGLRGVWMWGLSAPFSVTAIALAALVAPFIGLTWSWIPAVLFTVVLAAVLWGARRLTVSRLAPAGAESGPVAASDGRPSKVRNASAWAFGVGVLLAAAVIAVRSVQIIGEPGGISQTFDNIYHLNAVRFILDTGSGSPLDVGAMTSANLWFYPVGWHDVATLVVQLTGVTIPVAVNTTWIVFSAVAWPLGIVLLSRVLGGSKPAVAIAAGLAAASIPAFPYLLVDYGVLYPYHAGVALVPGAVAATVALFRLGRESTGLDPVWSAVVLAGALPALALTHPGAFMAWLAFSLPIAVIALIRLLRSGAAARTRIMAIAGFAVYLAVGLVAIRVLRPPLEATLWPAIGLAGQALGEVITVSMYHTPIAEVVAVAMIAGVVFAAIRRRSADWVAMSLLVVAGSLYIIVAGVSSATIRNLITASWYNNTPRLAALVVIAVVPLAAIGVGRLWQKLTETRVYGRVVGSRGRGLRIVVAVLAVVLLGLSMQGRSIAGAVDGAGQSYRISPKSALISSDELQLLEELPDLVPADVAIAGSPWTGTGLAYAISDRRVLMPHTLMDISDDVVIINDELDEADADAALCAALEAENVGFVLDFGAREVHGGKHVFTGFDDLASSDSVRLVREVGDARLYEITACGGLE